MMENVRQTSSNWTTETVWQEINRI